MSRARQGISVKIFVEEDFIADGATISIYPAIGEKWLHFALIILMDILF